MNIVDSNLCHLELDEQYMNSKQQNYFRHKLLRWREGLLAELKQSQDRIRSNEPSGGDLIDQSVHDRNKIMDFIARDRVEKTIVQINAALRRLDEGSYGYCLASGEEIGLQRLHAYPIATLSVEAQEQLENRQRLVHC